VHPLSSADDERLAAEAGNRRQQPAPEAEQRCCSGERSEEKSRSREGSVERF